MKLTPVDYDPFAPKPSPKQAPTLTPVDYDPFANNPLAPATAHASDDIANLMTAMAPKPEPSLSERQAQYDAGYENAANRALDTLPIGVPEVVRDVAPSLLKAADWFRGGVRDFQLGRAASELEATLDERNRHAVLPAMANTARWVKQQIVEGKPVSVGMVQKAIPFMPDKENRALFDRVAMLGPEAWADMILAREGSDVTRGIELEAQAPLQAAELVKRQQAAEEIPRSPVSQDVIQAKTLGEALSLMMEDPFGFVAETGIRSLPQMAQPLAEGAAGGATLGPIGFAAGMGHGSFSVDRAAELAGGMLQILQERGVDVRNPQAIVDALDDPGVMEAIQSNARTHASFVGLFDALSGGVASRTFGLGLKNALAKELANVAVQMPIQGTLGAAGEIAGQVARGDEIQWGEGLAEFAGEGVTAPVDTATAAFTGARQMVTDPARLWAKAIERTNLSGAEEIARAMLEPVQAATPPQSPSAQIGGQPVVAQPGDPALVNLAPVPVPTPPHEPEPKPSRHVVSPQRQPDAEPRVRTDALGRGPKEVPNAYREANPAAAQATLPLETPEAPKGQPTLTPVQGNPFEGPVNEVPGPVRGQETEIRGGVGVQETNAPTPESAVAEVPDRAFNGDLEESLASVFYSDAFTGESVPLANRGFTGEEIAALQRAGMADASGSMNRAQFGTWMEERGRRLYGKRATPPSAPRASSPTTPAPKAKAVPQSEREIRDDLDFIDGELPKYYSPEEIATMQQQAPQERVTPASVDWWAERLVEGQRRGEREPGRVAPEEGDARTAASVTDGEENLLREGAPTLRAQGPPSAITGQSIDDSIGERGPEAKSTQARPEKAEGQDTAPEEAPARPAPKVSALSLSSEDNPYTLAALLMKLIAEDDAAFQTPISHKKTMEGIAEDVGLLEASEWKDSPFNGKEDKDGEVVARTWRVKVPQPSGQKPKEAMIFQRRNGDVYIDVSRLKEGTGGSLVYNLAANYSYNNNVVFVGDPSGLTDKSMLRRASNLLSSVIKFGTSQHVRPHPFQLQGYGAFPPLSWREGDDQHNLEALLRFEYENVARKVPEIRDIVYDLEHGQFKDTETNEPVAEAMFGEQAKSRGAREAQAGRATIKRAALINTVVRGTGQERSRILGQILRLKGQHVGSTATERIFYSQRKPGASAGLSASAVQKQIDPILEKWANAPRVEVIESIGELPKGTFSASVDTTKIRGFITKDGVVYLVADKLENARAVQETLFHEALGHYGLRGVFGAQLDKVLDQVYWTLRLKQPEWVRELNGEYQFDLRTREGKRRLAEEALAQMAENEANRKPVQGTWKRFLAWVKRWMARMGFPVTFTDEQLQDILADAATHVREGKATKISGEVAFSLSDEARAMERVSEAAQEAPTYRDWVKGKTIEDTRPAWLGALTRRHIADIGSGVLPQLGIYVKTASKMDADRNHLVNEAADLAKQWSRFYARHREDAEAMARLMHESTVAGVDPSEAYQAVIDETEARERIKGLRAQARSRSGEGTAKFMREIEEIKRKVGFEKTRPAAYERLRKQYEHLPAEARELFQTIRDLYASRFKATQDALVKRIERAELSAAEKRAMIMQIRQQFESAMVEAPYFPLARFGDFWVSLEKGSKDDPVREFYMFESSTDQRKFAAKARREGWRVTVGKKLENVQAIHGASMGFVADVIGILDKVGGGQAEMVKDSVYQLFLTNLPDLSVRKHFIHRQKTAGYTQDALRAFAYQTFHGSYQLAKLRYADILEAQLENMRNGIGESKDPNKASDIYNEMLKRHEWAMNPQSAPWANVATSVGFAWYLGLTPAAAMVNTTQTAFVALPVMAAQHGWKKSAAALTKASGDFFRGGFEVTGNITGDERRAIEQLIEDGVIEKTLAHDLVGMSETPSAVYSPTKSRAMEVISFLFHHAERFNREVTALAAYRLARKAGKPHAEAVDEAANVVWESHFDYSNANKARFMQSDAARVLLLFKQYSLNMTYLLARSAHQALKGETKAVRKLARRKLAGVLGMHAIGAGFYGMPLFWLVESVLNAIFDDEDDPWDFKTEFRNFLADYFGETVADAITVGPVEALTGVGLHSRVSLNELWFREPNRDLEGRAYVAYWLEQVAGPLAAIFINAGRGYDLINEGHVQRGIEAMLPKFVKDGLKAMRYASEGVLSLRGDPIVADLSAWETSIQAIGFTPGSIAKAYDTRSALKKKVNRINERRTHLINRWWLAKRTGDREGVRDALADIRKFNKKQPQNRITRDTLVRSAKMRRRASRETVDGVRLPKRMRHLKEEVRY